MSNLWCDPDIDGPSLTAPLFREQYLFLTVPLCHGLVLKFHRYCVTFWWYVTGSLNNAQVRGASMQGQ
jgi:hypothetical protein